MIPHYHKNHLMFLYPSIRYRLYIFVYFLCTCKVYTAPFNLLKVQLLYNFLKTINVYTIKTGIKKNHAFISCLQLLIDS